MFGYPKGYRVKSIKMQIEIVRRLFPGIGYVDEEFVTRLSIPRGVEALFAIPRWEKLAPTYNEAVELVLRKIAGTRTLINNYQGQLGPDRLRQHARSIEMWARLGEQQKDHDILFVPVQFGLLHRGRSVGRASELFMATEFGLGAYASGIMLLTHPNRFVSYNDLWIVCAGDEYDGPLDDDRFSRAPCFGFSRGTFRFGTDLAREVCEDSGSVTAFLPSQ